MIVSESIDLFLSSIAGDRAALTMKTYRGRLNGLRKSSLGRREISTLVPLSDQPSEIGAWLESQKTFQSGKDKAPDTIRLTIISVELWQAWLLKEKHIPAALVGKQKKPGGRKREILPNLDETRKLLENAPEDFKIAYRALRLTGARPGELSKARISDFDQRQSMIFLKEHKTAKKTGQVRKIPVGHAALVEIITTAIGERTEGPIFLRSNGKPWTTEALSATYRRLRKAAGLPSGLVLYLARHEHATQLYEETRDLKTVADALGHTQIQTTMRYAHSSAETLKKNQQIFNEGL